jgi:hypothetical protein
MAEWVGLVALIVALIAIPVTIWATRQWGNRRARLEFLFESVPLLPENTRAGLLEVTYRGIPVEDPHLVTVTITNVGPRDLASGMFDRDRPMEVRFNQTFYGLTSVQGGVRAISPAVGASAADATIELAPGLLKKGDAWAISAVLSGLVEVDLYAPLIDTDIRQVLPHASGSSEITVSISALGLPVVQFPLGSLLRYFRRG